MIKFGTLFSNPYELSTDYSLLYSLICKRFVIVAFVDYQFKTDISLTHRDICTIRRFDKFNIQISARGIGYGGLYGYEEYLCDEKEMFIAICNKLKIEYFSIGVVNEGAASEASSYQNPAGDY